MHLVFIVPFHVTGQDKVKRLSERRAQMKGQLTWSLCPRAEGPCDQWK